MAIEDKTTADESESPKVAPPKPDYKKDKNVNKRLNAGKRSSARNAGKEIADIMAPEAEMVPPDGGPTPEDVPVAYGEPGEDAGEAEGGIVAEAQEELAVAEAAVEEAAESPAEESAETPAEESAEPMEAPAMDEPAMDEPTMVEPAEDAPAMDEPAMDEPTAVGDYESPDGQDHEELIDQYHEALMFGDKETAKALYRQLQNHRYSENIHRSKSEAQAEKEAREYVEVARKLAAAHPELNEDGLESDKVMALADIYRNLGDSAAVALQKAVADLYPEAAAPAPMAEAPMAEPETPAAVAEEAPAATEAPAPEPEEVKQVVPDMTERKNAKRSIPAVPSATVRNEPAPAKPEPTRSDAIAQIKKSRGQ